MALEEKRNSYVKEYVQLVSDSGDSKENKLQRVLPGIMMPALKQLEERLMAHRDRWHFNKQKDIAELEEFIRNRLYLDEKLEERSEASNVHRMMIDSCYLLLIENLDLSNSSLLDDLWAAGIVSVYELERIKECGLRKQQNERFLAMMDSKCLTFQEFHKVFLPALSKDHEHVADAMIHELDKLEDEYEYHNSECVACRVRKFIEPARLATTLRTSKVIDMSMFFDLKSHGLTNKSKWTRLMKTVSDADIIKAIEKKYPDFYQVFKQLNLGSLKCLCQDIQEHLDQCYEMTANPRGICLIVDNSDRRNAKIDVFKLSTTFRRLRFAVEIRRDLTYIELRRVLYDFSVRDHNQHDAFVCAIIPKEDKDKINCLSVSDIVAPFMSTVCPALAGKPKVLIFGASEMSIPMGYTPKTYFADEADFLIVRSTDEYCTDVRHSSEGSYYIHTLTKVLNSQDEQHDLVERLTLHKRKPPNVYSSDYSFQRRDVTSVVSTLTKKLFFRTDP